MVLLIRESRVIVRYFSSFISGSSKWPLRANVRESGVRETLVKGEAGGEARRSLHSRLIFDELTLFSGAL